jgi:hypothetical protein
MEKATDNKALATSKTPFPWESEIGSRLTMGDICWYQPGMLNKIGKEGKTSWDSFSYALMMAHNVNSHISSVQRANHLVDIECARYQPNWKAWGIEGKKEKELSDWVPRRILYFSRFIKELFETTTKQEAFDMIDEGIGFLRSLEGTRSQDGMARNTFFNLFEEEAKGENDLDLSNPDDDELRALEESVDNE